MRGNITALVANFAGVAKLPIEYGQAVCAALQLEVTRVGAPRELPDGDSQRGVPVLVMVAPPHRGEVPPKI